MTHTITMKEIQQMNCDTFSRKDDSPRSIETVFKDDLSVGDEVIINNHFTVIIE